jgi:hypothetical protein
LFSLKGFFILLKLFFSLFDLFVIFADGILDQFKLVFFVGFGLNQVNSLLMSFKSVVGDFFLDLSFTAWDFSY